MVFDALECPQRARHYAFFALPSASWIMVDHLQETGIAIVTAGLSCAGLSRTGLGLGRAGWAG